MPEETIWKGTSSQWKNCGAFAMLILSVPVSVGLHMRFRGTGIAPWSYLLFVAAALWTLWKWVQLKTTVFHLTTERLLTVSGLLTKVTDTLELYRVRDLKIVQPLTQRLLGLQNIDLFTSDASSAEVNLDFVPVNLNLGDKIRKCVETCRSAKNVRMMDVVEEHPGDAPTGH